MILKAIKGLVVLASVSIAIPQSQHISLPALTAAPGLDGSSLGTSSPIRTVITVNSNRIDVLAGDEKDVPKVLEKLRELCAGPYAYMYPEICEHLDSVTGQELEELDQTMWWPPADGSGPEYVSTATKSGGGVKSGHPITTAASPTAAAAPTLPFLPLETIYDHHHVDEHQETHEHDQSNDQSHEQAETYERDHSDGGHHSRDYHHSHSHYSQHTRQHHYSHEYHHSHGHTSRHEHHHPTPTADQAPRTTSPALGTFTVLSPKQTEDSMSEFRDRISSHGEQASSSSLPAQAEETPLYCPWKEKSSGKGKGVPDKPSPCTVVTIYHEVSKTVSTVVVRTTPPLVTPHQEPFAIFRGCTQTVSVLKRMNNPFTSTVYPSTVTRTIPISCSCPNLETMYIGGHGLVVRPRTTVTASEPSTTRTYVCTTTGLIM
ncbi:hypothetical protein B0T22DRAFT_160411 [Podospora appendiculata]|uniref:Uncharacterized protein n=1 Tax=Podospora appendiculata TaxID=314037 RepID=A0AAE0X9V3_9PEZI|nr:hypothetical protein B0T22DRAFT_160411 [Podospora appendiculata]